MTMLDVTPEALLAASAQVEALTGRLMGANGVHAAVTAGILPPGSDMPSIKLAADLIGHSVAHEVAAGMGSEELLRSGLAVAESGMSYLTGDTAGAAALGAAAI